MWIIVGAVAVVGVILLIVSFVLPTNNSQQTPAPEPTSEPAPEPTPTPAPEPKPNENTGTSTTNTPEPGGTSVPITADNPLLGSWVALDSEDPTMPPDYFVQMSKQGIYIVLTLKQDGTGVFKTDTGPVDLTWTMSDDGSATMKIGESLTTLKRDGEDLIMINGNGLKMTFVPADQIDMSNAVEVGGPTDPGTGTTTPQASEGMQRVGNDKVGFLQVPTTWTDRSGDLDPGRVSSNSTVYFVDPSTEFTSPTRGKFDFAKSIAMDAEEGSYKTAAAEVAAGHEVDSYGETTTSELSIGGRNAMLVVSSIPKDNLNIASILIDRDGDEKNTVRLTLNCGAADSTTAASEVLSYVSKWTVS